MVASRGWGHLVPKLRMLGIMTASSGEAGISSASLWKRLFLLVALFMRSIGMFACGLRLLPGLGRMLLALGMVILAVRIRGGAV
jgi:hypothetical protein